MSNGSISRRKFIATAAVGTAASMAFPYIATASKTSDAVIVGEGEHTYEAHHDWAKLPSKFKWQTTHNVAVDAEGLVYIIHEGHQNLKDHPSIFVFDKDGNYVRSFGKEFQGGGHGIEVRKEGNEEFLYVCNYQVIKNVCKLNLKGERVWEILAPKEAGIYHADEYSDKRAAKWGKDRFLPTNTAFLDDGSFFVADGYGSFYIHHYDKDAKWLAKFGGPNSIKKEDGKLSNKKEDGKFNTPHGIWIDSRPKDGPQICIADRANGRLQWFTLDFKHLKTMDGFHLPANIDIRGDVMLVPDLVHLITLLDKDNKVITHLGNNPDWIKKADSDRSIRGKPKQWQAGCFIHPHDACFDHDGNIMVAEWVYPGRISMLKKVGG